MLETLSSFSKFNTIETRSYLQKQQAQLNHYIHRPRLQRYPRTTLPCHCLTLLTVPLEQSYNSVRLVGKSMVFWCTWLQLAAVSRTWVSLHFAFLTMITLCHLGKPSLHVAALSMFCLLIFGKTSLHAATLSVVCVSSWKQASLHIATLNQVNIWMFIEQIVIL